MRVLLVDDEEHLVGALRSGLQREGFAVDSAPDGEQGLWLATENDYDVIVLDIMLPRRNGYQVCAQLRQAGVWTRSSCSRPRTANLAKSGDSGSRPTRRAVDGVAPRASEPNIFPPIPQLRAERADRGGCVPLSGMPVPTDVGLP